MVEGLELSELKLDHFFSLCDDTGVFQHATFGVANRHEGYCTDDVSRALIFLCKYMSSNHPDQRFMRAFTTCLSFMHHSALPAGHFHNFMSFDRRWLDDVGSDDSQGRAMWSFGTVCNTKFIPDAARDAAEEVFRRNVVLLPTFKAPRTLSFGMLGCAEAAHIEVSLDTLKQCADKLIAMYDHFATEKWPWFENCLTYCNARMPQALYRAYEVLRDERYLEVAEKTMRFLIRIMFENGVLHVPGNEEWCAAGCEKSAFDQQPVEAGSMAEALLCALRITGNMDYLAYANSAMMWYFGRNRLGQKLIDESIGACYDGLRATGVNKNQGAEALLSFLMARVTYDWTIQAMQSAPLTGRKLT